MMDNFNDFIKLHAICKYLQSFGYKAMVHDNSMSVHLKEDATILVLTTWEAAREFIKVRSQD
jgi:hypothetical protein